MLGFQQDSLGKTGSGSESYQWNGNWIGGSTVWLWIICRGHRDRTTHIRLWRKPVCLSVPAEELETQSQTTKHCARTFIFCLYKIRKKAPSQNKRGGGSNLALTQWENYYHSKSNGHFSREGVKIPISSVMGIRLHISERIVSPVLVAVAFVKLLQRKKERKEERKQGREKERR